MGNTDSVPVVSQVCVCKFFSSNVNIYILKIWAFGWLQDGYHCQAKSLVQAISGDMEGAKKTQEQFLRTGLIASQVN